MAQGTRIQVKKNETISVSMADLKRKLLIFIERARGGKDYDVTFYGEKALKLSAKKPTNKVCVVCPIDILRDEWNNAISAIRETGIFYELPCKDGESVVYLSKHNENNHSVVAEAFSLYKKWQHLRFDSKNNIADHLASYAELLVEHQRLKKDYSALKQELDNIKSTQSVEFMEKLDAIFSRIDQSFDVANALEDKLITADELAEKVNQKTRFNLAPAGRSHPSITPEMLEFSKNQIKRNH